MAKTDMKLTTTDTMGNTNTATITYVNPNATSSQLVTLGRMLTSLTSSAYNKTDRINTINCDASHNHAGENHRHQDKRIGLHLLIG